MDITIYLPDELAQRAKARADINLSRMLRDALTAKFAEEETVAATLKDAEEYKLQLENQNGTTYVGRITGTRIAANDDLEVFLTDKENVVVYHSDTREYFVESGEVDLYDMIGDEEVYLDAMGALGREATIDLDV